MRPPSDDRAVTRGHQPPPPAEIYLSGGRPPCPCGRTKRAGRLRAPQKSSSTVLRLRLPRREQEGPFAERAWISSSNLSSALFLDSDVAVAPRALTWLPLLVGFNAGASCRMGTKAPAAPDSDTEEEDEGTLLEVGGGGFEASQGDSGHGLCAQNRVP